MTSDKYKLVYWPTIPGRAEAIRLAFEQAGVSYEDTALQLDHGAAAKEVMSLTDPSFKPGDGQLPPFAVPALYHGSTFLSQTPNILFYLGPRLGLVPDDEVGRLRVNQTFLTLSDFQNEIHDTHHPIAVGDYYENQKEAAFRRSIDLRLNRIPKFLSYFDRLVTSPSDQPFLVGNKLSYADLTLWNIVEGLKFAFPNATARELPNYKGVQAVYESVKNLPKIKAYLESDRRLAFGNGLFRSYPELDQEEDLEKAKKEQAEKKV